MKARCSLSMKGEVADEDEDEEDDDEDEAPEDEDERGVSMRKAAAFCMAVALARAENGPPLMPMPMPDAAAPLPAGAAVESVSDIWCARCGVVDPPPDMSAVGVCSGVGKRLPPPSMPAAEPPAPL